MIWLTLSYFIQQLFDAYGEVTFWGYNPKQHMSRIEQTQKLINKSMMKPDEDPDEHQHSDEEHSNILMFIWRTQQHSDGQNVHPEFQVKVCGAQDTWHNTIGHPTTAIWAQKLYK